MGVIMGKISICINLGMVVLGLGLANSCLSATRTRTMERSQKPYHCTNPQVVPVVSSRAASMIPAQLTRKAFVGVHKVLKACNAQLAEKRKQLQVYLAANPELTDDQITEESEGVRLHAHIIILEEHRKELLKRAFLKACMLSGVDSSEIELVIKSGSQDCSMNAPITDDAVKELLKNTEYCSFLEKLSEKISAGYSPHHNSEGDKTMLYVDDDLFGDLSYGEWVFVFCHELQHFTQKHMEKRYKYVETLYREHKKNTRVSFFKKIFIPSALAAVFLGLYSESRYWKPFGFGTIITLAALMIDKAKETIDIKKMGKVNNIPLDLRYASFQKEQEYEADLKAAQLSEFNLLNGLQFLIRCADNPRVANKGTPYESHPSPSQRFERLKAYAIAQGYTVELKKNNPQDVIPQVILVKNTQTLVR